MLGQVEEVGQCHGGGWVEGSEQRAGGGSGLWPRSEGALAV